MKTETKTTKAAKTQAPKAEKTVTQKIQEGSITHPSIEAHQGKGKGKGKAEPKATKAAKAEPKAPKAVRHETIARTGFDGTYTLANGIMPTDVVDAVIGQVLLGKKSASGLRRVARKYVGTFTTPASLENGAKDAGLNIADKGVILLKVKNGTALFKPLSPKALDGVVNPKAKAAPKADVAKAEPKAGKAKGKAAQTKVKDEAQKA